MPGKHFKLYRMVIVAAVLALTCFGFIGQAYATPIFINDLPAGDFRNGLPDSSMSVIMVGYGADLMEAVRSKRVEPLVYSDVEPVGPGIELVPLSDDQDIFPIPEPSTKFLFCIGLSGVAGVCWKVKKIDVDADFK